MGVHVNDRKEETTGCEKWLELDRHSALVGKEGLQEILGCLGAPFSNGEDAGQQYAKGRPIAPYDRVGVHVEDMRSGGGGRGGQRPIARNR